MRILVYQGKHGDAFWMADTSKRGAGAREALFKMLDADGYYEYNVNTARLQLAREGNTQAIASILNNHNGYEYESWSYEEAEVLE